MAPSSLGKYELISEIGHGGMATVYRARDTRLGREVAIKLIHHHLRDNKEVAERFVAEARAVAKLKHPGIVEIFDVSEETDAERYLVAELVRGPSLRTIVSQQKEIPAEIGACVGALLCGALAHAHEVGIIHRDVKPENVLVELDDTTLVANTKLTDFGIAKVLDAKGVTSAGQVLGSPAHMAPEQIEGGDVDARTDVFGVGVMIYECMVGHLPFDGNNPAQVLRNVLEGAFAPADTERPKVGARWGAIVARAIARDRNARYPDASSLQRALYDELRDMGFDEPAQELYQYLKDPDSYTKTHATRVVDRLVARADRARKRAKVPAAAAHLNRAFAYAPDDVNLLRQVNRLARGQQRRRIMGWAAGAAIAVLAVASVSLGALRYGRRQGRTADPVIETVDAGLADSGVSAAPSALVSTPARTGAPSGSAPLAVVPTLRFRPAVSASIRAIGVDREVLVQANPQSAIVSVNGRPAVDVEFGLKLRLPVGSNTFVFSVREGNRCCESVSVTKEIKPDDGTGPQVVTVSLPFRPATIALTGAPADARLRCPMARVDVGSGSDSKVEMVKVERVLTCLLEGSGASLTQVSVTLRAGHPTLVQWPSSP